MSSRMSTSCASDASDRSAASDQGGVAVAEPEVETELEAGQPVVITVEDVEHDEHIENVLEIHGRWSGQDRLIATIEVVSPSNKTPGDEGYDKYRAKQREVLAGQAHLIEIDLLRAGRTSPRSPETSPREKAGPFDYHVSVHRFDRPKDFLVYPIRLRQRLPVITVPLLPADPPCSSTCRRRSTAPTTPGPTARPSGTAKTRSSPPLRPEQAAVGRDDP